MKYMLLIHHDEDLRMALGETELQRMRAKSVQLANEIDSKGSHWIGRNPPGNRTRGIAEKVMCTFFSEVVLPFPPRDKAGDKALSPETLFGLLSSVGAARRAD